MKSILRFSVCLMFAAASHAMAAFESARLDPDKVTPRFPQTLIFDGVSEGFAVFAVSVSAEGKFSDSVVLAYTREPFVRACREAMKDWKVTPARYDGENVPVQMELRIDFRREGYVETSNVNITNNFLRGNFVTAHERSLSYRLPRRNELDRSPVPVTTVEPLYANEARQQGVTGKVHVYFYIDEKGEVRLPSVDSTSHPYLSDIAVTALKGWRFEPATRRGHPVLVAATQEFDFGAK